MPSYQPPPHQGLSQLVKNKPKRKRGWLAKVALGLLGLVAFFYVLIGCMILSLRWINPPTTMVRLQREVSAAWAKKPYQEHMLYVPISRIASDLQYAVVAAEDGRFYVHHGFDWVEMQKVMKSDMAKRQLGRGASTITQQLTKNLFLGTERSVIKKGVEFTLAPLVELCLGKQRILELYLNEIEWGPGIFGAEAATEHWYHTPASAVTRVQAAHLAAIIPNPLRRSPAREDEYAEEILARMTMMGW